MILQNWNNCVLFRFSDPRDAAGVATLAQKIETEKRMRDLLESGGLPQPDYIEYGYTCIRLILEEPKLCVVIDIDEPPEGEEAWTTDDLDPAA